MPQLSPMSWTMLFITTMILTKMLQMSKSMKKLPKNKKMKTTKTKWSW